MTELDQVRPGESSYEKNAARDNSAIAGHEPRDRGVATHFAS